MRRIIYWGNCQMLALHGMHQRFIAPLTDEETVWVNPYQTTVEKQRAEIARSDLVVGQVNTKASIAELDNVAGITERHLVPAVNAGFLWPFAGQRHPKSFKLVIGDYVDSFLNRMLKQNVPPEEAVQRYLELDVNAMVNLDRLLEVSIDQQRRLDALTDYNFADRILDRFRDEYLFLKPYHLNVALSHYWAREIFRHLGIDEEIITRLQEQQTWAPFPQDETPIHPAVIRHFGLRFLPEQPRYRFSTEGEVTFSEFALRYLRFDWNEELDEGTALARAGKRTAALEKLGTRRRTGARIAGRCSHNNASPCAGEPA